MGAVIVTPMEERVIENVRLDVLFVLVLISRGFPCHSTPIGLHFLDLLGDFLFVLDETVQEEENDD